METMLLSLAIVALSFVGLALGAIAGRAPLTGSCGGVACIKGMKCAACADRVEGTTRT